MNQITALLAMFKGESISRDENREVTWGFRFDVDKPLKEVATIFLREGHKYRLHVETAIGYSLGAASEKKVTHTLDATFKGETAKRNESGCCVWTLKFEVIDKELVEIDTIFFEKGGTYRVEIYDEQTELFPKEEATSDSDQKEAVPTE